MDTSVLSAIAAMRLDDPELAADASAAWDCVDGTDEAERVTQWRVQSFCWLQLPRDRFAAPPMRTAAALAELLSRLGLTRYADIARGETTAEILAVAQADGRWSDLTERAMTASGIEPPDTALLSWAFAWGRAEAITHEAVADALELAVQVGEYTPGRSGWRTRRAEIADRVLLAEHDLLGGAVAYDAIVGERVDAWIASTRSALRTRLLAPAATLLVEPVVLPDPATIERLLGQVARYLRFVGDGLPLTSAGYLKPASVERCIEDLGLADDVFGPSRREVDQPPVLQVRAAMQHLGLVRRHSGRLLLSTAGRAALADPSRLWSEVAARLVPEPGSRAAGREHGTLVAWDLVLATLAVANSVNRRQLVADCRVVLAESGWRLAGGELIDAEATTDLYSVVFRVLSGLGVLRRWRPSESPGVDRAAPGADLLLRAALRHRLVHSRTLVYVPR